jgi:hypothetical protein
LGRLISSVSERTVAPGLTAKDNWRIGTPEQLEPVGSLGHLGVLVGSESADRRTRGGKCYGMKKDSLGTRKFIEQRIIGPYRSIASN